MIVINIVIIIIIIIIITYDRCDIFTIYMRVWRCKWVTYTKATLLIMQVLTTIDFFEKLELTFKKIYIF